MFRLVCVTICLLRFSCFNEDREARALLQNEKRFSRQLGSFTNLSLCKNGLAFHATNARSTVKCFAKAQVLCRKCSIFKYVPSTGLCSLYDGIIKYDFDEFSNDSCLGYQAVTGKCASGFTRLIETDKCIKLLTLKKNWSDSRKLCNALHPRSHPVILDTRTDMTIYTRLVHSVKPRCRHPIDSGIYFYWTAGISPYFNSTRLPFQWMPFPNDSRNLKNPSLWLQGQPDSLKDGRPNCIQGFTNPESLVDFYCSYLIECVICEIDEN